jgi:para-aminobenzoate synthetase component I
VIQAFELESAPTPVEACARLLDWPYPLLLESARPDEDAARYSFLTADPWHVLLASGDGPDPLEALERALKEFRLERLPELPPFQGGAAGYLGYELCHRLERLPAPRHDDLALPEACLGLYDWTLAWDHARARTWLLSTGLPDRGPAREARARARAEEVKRRLSGPARVAARSVGASRGGSAPGLHPVPGLPGFSSTFSREGFVSAVARTRDYVLAGDIFQANLSQRLEAAWSASAFELYCRLRERNPAPFAGYFDLGSAQVVSASPERFLLLTGDRVETRPIKGTSPRGISPRHDSALGEALSESEKDRAENVMIVDLLRNDLSRVCRDDSVEVTELCRIERYATVHHLVSTVVGRLRAGLGAVDLLRATWPGGSITGAPKVRAMEIIAELEPTRRSVYTGSLGYLSFGGDMDLSIAIRTFVVTGGRAYVQAGAGIVADSSPEREYDETLDKARGMAAALEAAP